MLVPSEVRYRTLRASSAVPARLVDWRVWISAAGCVSSLVDCPATKIRALRKLGPDRLGPDQGPGLGRVHPGIADDDVAIGSASVGRDEVLDGVRTIGLGGPPGAGMADGEIHPPRLGVALGRIAQRLAGPEVGEAVRLGDRAAGGKQRRKRRRTKREIWRACDPPGRDLCPARRAGESSRLRKQRRGSRRSRSQEKFGSAPEKQATAAARCSGGGQDDRQIFAPELAHASSAPYAGN